MTRRSREAGFTLLEVGVALALIGLIVSGGLVLGGRLLEKNAYRQTGETMERIEQALADFAAQQARLPCPATDANGLEDRRPTGHCDDDQQNGVVPWRTLALTQDDAIDAWGRLITYRVYDHGSNSLTLSSGGSRNGPLDLRYCDPSRQQSNPKTTASTCAAPSANGSGNTPLADYLYDKGIRVGDETTTTTTYNLADPEDLTGAAYVLISHGENGLGAMLPSGSVLATTPPPDPQGPPETKLVAWERNQRVGASWDENTIIRVDANLTLDDVVRWRTILQVAEASGAMAPDLDALMPEGGGANSGDDGTIQPPDLSVDLSPQALATAVGEAGRQDASNISANSNTYTFAGGTMTASGGNDAIGYGDDGVGVYGTRSSNSAELNSGEELQFALSASYTHFRLVMTNFNGGDAYDITLAENAATLGTIRIRPPERYGNTAVNSGGQGAYLLDLNIDGQPWNTLTISPVSGESYLYMLDICERAGQGCSVPPTSTDPRYREDNDYPGQWCVRGTTGCP